MNHQFREEILRFRGVSMILIFEKKKEGEKFSSTLNRHIEITASLDSISIFDVQLFLC